MDRTRLRAIVRQDHRRKNRRLALKAAEAEPAALREQAAKLLPPRAAAPLNLSLRDQLRRLALDPRYRRYFASKPGLEEAQREYPELTAPVDPDLLTEIVNEMVTGGAEHGEAFISPPVKVLRTFDMDTHPDFDSDKENVPTPHYIKERPESEKLPPGENPAFTFFYDADLLQGRFLHLQIDLSARKEKIVRQIEAVVRAAREVAGRTKTRQRPISREVWKVIEAALRLGTTSPSEIAAELRPDLYDKKTAQNRHERRMLELTIVRAIDKAKEMDILR